MQLVPILVAVALVVFFVWVIVRAQLAGRRPAYSLRKSLFTPAERVFLRALERALPRDVRVFGKVRLEDIFAVGRGFTYSERLAARNRINRRHVDFLLVREGDFAPLAGIELDDSSHEQESRRRRDALVDFAFVAAGLPLLHVAVEKDYKPAEVKAKVAELLGKRG